MNKMLVALLLLFAISAEAGELYLLKINSRLDLKNAQQVIKKANALIDNKFLVNLSDEQRDALIKSKLIPEELPKGVFQENLCLVFENRKDIKAALDYSAIYNGEQADLAEIQPESELILDRAGYQVIPIRDKDIPLFYNKPAASGYTTVDFPTDSLADLVIEDSLYSYNTRLEAFQTRFLDTDSCEAARHWLISKFRSFGYNDVDSDNFYVTRESYGVFNVLSHNVICTKVGSEQPDKYILIGAHYDSYNHDSDFRIFAPGADDNGSGTSCVLELARVLAAFDNRKTIMFVAFGAEEMGLYGSEHLAETLYNEGVDLEIMINLDMVGFTEDDDPDMELGEDMCPRHFEAFESIADNLCSLYVMENSSSSSDHLSFGQFGFPNMFLQEGDFNYGGWHTDIDLTSRMDFPYMTKLARILAAGVGLVDRAVDPVPFHLTDIGDGQSLRVTLEQTVVGHSYIAVYGTGFYDLNDTVTVPPWQNYIDLTGLTEGTNYYVGVIGESAGGYSQLNVPLETEQPFSIPRTPEYVRIDIDSAQLIIEWENNRELDFSHYEIFRQPVGQNWETIEANYTDSIYFDQNVVGHQEYMYKIIAVDLDANVSDTSLIVGAIPATFDGGILFIEETQTGGINPSETFQNSFYGNMLDGYSFYRSKIDDAEELLTGNLAGQYNPLFWVDDDDTLHFLEGSLDTLQWFLEYETDILLAGWGTIYEMTGQAYFYPGSFYYDKLGLGYVARNPIQDFIGPTAENGWPELELKPEAPYSGRLPDIQIFTPAAGAEVIYRFESFSGNPFYGDKPVGYAFDTYQGKRVVLGFPLFWLTDESAEALINKVMAYFASPSEFVYGDVNDDRIVNLLDITYLIAYLYASGPPPVRINHGDPNNDCTINILDVVYLINYLYNAGAEPLSGCVAP